MTFFPGGLVPPALYLQVKFGLQLRSKELDSGGRAPCKQDHGHGLGIYFGKENNSSRRVILQIELELNKLNSILSRSAVTPVFPLPLAQAKACRG